MECGTGTSTAQSRPSSSQWVQTGQRAARQAPARLLPFVNAASHVTTQKSTLVSDASKRQTLQQLMLAAAALSSDATSHLVHPHRAGAALVQFPVADLRNSYYLVRAGEGQCEADNYVLTNTVFKTSTSNGLSKTGKRQVARQIVPALRELDACPDGGCWLWPSITQRSYQTAEILASLLGTGYSRIVPEYSFLDPRGVGSLEGLSYESANQQLQEGDLLSPNWRPRLGTDGTPNESSQDVLIRVRQVMSICETQWSNNNVIIISPDSDNLSILQAGVLGIDLRRHHDFAFAPGEVRPLQMAAEPTAVVSRSYTCRNPPKCF
ncbi:TPA: hypothetical protein ACH3X1_016035 [Trebouxia sp. C0004]